MLRAAVVLVAMLVAGCCRARQGDPCSRGQAACADEHDELACEEGRFVRAPCRGPRGCKFDRGVVTCDVSANAAGDVCSKDDDGKASCTATAKERVECAEGKYRVLPCRGAGACKHEDGGVACDTSIAEPGDACDAPPPGRGNHACSVDGKNLLACRNGEFVVEQGCRGPDACAVRGGVPVCDVSIADPGDACGSAVEGKHACSVDKKSLLVCKDGKFVEEQPCNGANGCSLTGDKITCE